MKKFLVSAILFLSFTSCVYAECLPNESCPVSFIPISAKGAQCMPLVDNLHREECKPIEVVQSHENEARLAQHCVRLKYFIMMQADDLAINEIDRIIEISDQKSQALHQKARIYFRQHIMKTFEPSDDESKISQAHKTILSAKEAKGDKTGIEATLVGVNSHRDHGWHDTLKAFLKVLMDEPNNHYALVNASEIATEMEANDLAIKLLDLRLKTEPENLYLYKMKGDALRKMGNAHQANADYDRYLAGPIYNPFDIDDIVEFKDMIGEKNSALALADRVLNDPRHKNNRYLTSKLSFSRALLNIDKGLNNSAKEDFITTLRNSNIIEVLRVQLFLKRRGMNLEINGRFDNRMETVVGKCFRTGQCASEIATTL